MAHKQPPYLFPGDDADIDSNFDDDDTSTTTIDPEELNTACIYGREYTSAYEGASSWSVDCFFTARCLTRLISTPTNMAGNVKDWPRLFRMAGQSTRIGGFIESSEDSILLRSIILGSPLPRVLQV